MVKLTKIYTKTGDDGATKLGSGETVAKFAERVEAYGTVDEANAAIGLAVAAIDRASESTDERLLDLHRALVRIQNDMFDVGADLCVPVAEDEGQALRVIDAQVEWLERTIDHHNDRLTPLRSFVLPGGSELAARLHIARTAVRAAERRVAALLEHHPKTTNRTAMVYLNRLSDLLFVLARVANDDGAADILWVPGANREG